MGFDGGIPRPASYFRFLESGEEKTEEQGPEELQEIFHGASALPQHGVHDPSEIVAETVPFGDVRKNQQFLAFSW